MITRKISIKILLAMVTITLFLTAFTPADRAALAAAATTKTVEADSTWVVSETTSLSSLTIGRRASITAPEDYSVTLTVDGVGTPIKYGTY